MEFEERSVRLRTGTCPSCTNEFAFVEGESVASRLASPPATSASEGDDDAAEAPTGSAEGPECEECGSPLTFREGP
ncbi:MAG TPA: hypothetical protein VEE83_00310, partial [Thermoplasmata archaeon]|nr:hypothetical protein [Thermoplasmata archaeon]